MLEQSHDHANTHTHLSNPPISQLELVIHNSPKCLQVGSFYNCYPDLYVYSDNQHTRKENILRHNNVNFPQNSTFEQYAMFVRYHLGGKFNHRFQKLSYALWVGDDKKLIQRFCRYGRHLDNELVYRFHCFRDLIMESVSNNELHFIPAILFFGVNINTLKAGLGASLWKMLCKNSASRNKLIFRCAAFTSTLNPFMSSRFSFDELKPPVLQSIPIAIAKPILEALNALPSGIMQSNSCLRAIDGNAHYYDYPENGDNEIIDIDPTESQIFRFSLTVATAAQQRKKVTDPHFFQDAMKTVKDCRRMAKRLNKPFNDLWSFNRIEREHKSLTKLFNTTIYPDYYQEYAFEIPWIRELHHQGVTATLLSSRAALITEGQELSHCVASYHDYVYSGRSIIFSLRTQDGQRSTLELGVRRGHDRLKLTKLQHKTKYDVPVENDQLNAAATHVFNIQMQLLAGMSDNEDSMVVVDNFQFSVSHHVLHATI